MEAIVHFFSLNNNLFTNPKVTKVKLNPKNCTKINLTSLSKIVYALNKHQQIYTKLYKHFKF